MALSDFSGPDYIDDWWRDLNERWPERVAISEYLVHRLVSRCKRSNHTEHSILELGVGGGALAASVLNALKKANIQPLHFTGIDIEPELTRQVEGRLSGITQTRIHIYDADLRDRGWTENLGQFDVIYSLQTFHDLGGQGALTAIYRRVFSLLSAGGLLINADFVIPFPNDNPEKPRRLPVDTHHHILTTLGYTGFKNEISMGKLACMTAGRD